MYRLFKGWWCQVFHNAPMCPVNGVWQCRTCQTKFVVNFERDLRPPVPRQPPPPEQALMEVAPQ